MTSVVLNSYNIDDAAVIAIVQHCPKLKTLILRSGNIAWTSLLTLSERGLPLKELDFYCIPNIPTVDIARRCSHALSCIRHLSTNYLNDNSQDDIMLIPYMTGLTSVEFNNDYKIIIPILTQYSHKLTQIRVNNKDFSISSIVKLCHANPVLQVLNIGFEFDVTDTALIELLHACPHLHSLRLSYETDITDIGILALSEHCTQLQWLDVRKNKHLTEAAVLQLLQRCHKLTTLEVSSSSLSEETWTQLDKNTQKRVSRW